MYIYSQDKSESRFRKDLINALNRTAKALEDNNSIAKDIVELTKTANDISKENIEFNKFMLRFNMNLVSLGELVECLKLDKNEIDELQRREQMRQQQAMAMSAQKGEPDPNGKTEDSH